jgi:hypothetical protein
MPAVVIKVTNVSMIAEVILAAWLPWLLTLTLMF